MKNKTIFAISLILAFSMFLTGCSKETVAENNIQEDVITLSSAAVEKAEIISEPAQEKEVEEIISTTAQVKTNEDLRYVLNPIVSGKIIQDNGKLGSYVRKGQVLAIVQNPEVVRINSTAMRDLHENEIAIRQAQNRYILAKANYERELRLYEQGISPQRDLLQAKTDMLLAKDDLESLKRRSQDIKTETKALLNVYGASANFDSNVLASASPVIAMRSGVITKKNVTIGSVVSVEQVLYEIQDLNNLWLDITLYSDNINKIKKGQSVSFVSDGIHGKTFEGKIDYIQPTGDDLSQTFIARAFIDNTSGLLKPSMFGNVTIKSGSKKLKVFVPEAAVQQYGKETFVFLNLGNNKFKKINVELGEKTNSGYFINSGINAGDEIVTSGSFTLKAEILKGEFAEDD